MSRDRDSVLLTHSVLSLERIIEGVADSSAGAISTFTGTTRSTFQGKVVHMLSYEAYEPLALKSLWSIIERARSQWSLVKVAIAHRLGKVDVGEASVIIAVSSVHRREGLAAVEFIIDTLKDETAIWKKEIYEDGSSTWKENCCQKKTYQPSQHL